MVKVAEIGRHLEIAFKDPAEEAGKIRALTELLLQRAPTVLTTHNLIFPRCGYSEDVTDTVAAIFKGRRVLLRLIEGYRSREHTAETMFYPRMNREDIVYGVDLPEEEREGRIEGVAIQGSWRGIRDFFDLYTLRRYGDSTQTGLQYGGLRLHTLSRRPSSTEAESALAIVEFIDRRLHTGI